MTQFLGESDSSATICSAMAMDDVAAGEGALRIAVTGPIRWMRKSSTSDPSGSTACARTPASAGTTWLYSSQGR